MMEIRAFIFDVDGVLTDTVEMHYRSWARLAEEEGLPISREINDRVRGLSRAASLAVFLGDRSVTEEQAREYQHRKNEYFLQELAELTEAGLLPGVLSLLVESKAAGLKIGIGSASKNAREVVCRLRHRPVYRRLLRRPPRRAEQACARRFPGRGRACSASHPRPAWSSRMQNRGHRSRPRGSACASSASGPAPGSAKPTCLWNRWTGSAWRMCSRCSGPGWRPDPDSRRRSSTKPRAWWNAYILNSAGEVIIKGRSGVL